MKVALLVRVSTDKQDFDRQINELTDTAKRDGHKLNQIDVFGEIISGYKAFKKEDSKLSELLGIIEDDPKTYKMIYVSEISRIGRNPIEVRKVIDRLSELKVPVYINNLKRATIDEKGERDFIMNIILQVLAEFSHIEIETLKSRVRSGLLHSVKKGHVGGGCTIAFGYRSANKMMVIDEEEALIVKRIYAYFLKGYGSKICLFNYNI